MSAVKPFTLALVCEELGPTEVHQRIGVNATGLPFNSLSAIEQGAGGRTNPMVNSGAIATVSLVRGTTADEKWANLHRVLSRFAGRELTIDEHGLRLGLGHQPSQPGHRSPAASGRRHLLGPT